MKPGDRVYWRSINGEYTGEVEAITPHGYLVRLDCNGKEILLTENHRSTGKYSTIIKPEKV